MSRSLTCFAGLLVGALGACRASSNPEAELPQLVFATASAWPERPPSRAPDAGRLVVTNAFEDSLSFFDAAQVGAASWAELPRAPVGVNPVELEAPHHAAISATGEYFYVALSNFAPTAAGGPHAAHGTSDVNGTLLKVRASDNRAVATARLDRSPGDLALSPDGKVVAVAHFDLLKVLEAQRGEARDPDARVLLIDAETLAVTARVKVCPAPHGLAFSRSGKRLYLACYSDEVAVVALDAPELPVTRVKIAANPGTAFAPIHQPYSLLESPLTGDVFVGCRSSGEVRVLLGGSLTLDPTRTRNVGGSPTFSAFSPSGTTLWVPHQGDDRISELDPATGAQRRLLTPPPGACLNVHQVLPTADGRYLVAVCEGTRVTPGTVLVFDTASGALVSKTEVGLYPDFIGWVKTP